MLISLIRNLCFDSRGSACSSLVLVNVVVSGPTSCPPPHSSFPTLIRLTSTLYHNKSLFLSLTTHVYILCLSCTSISTFLSPLRSVSYTCLFILASSPKLRSPVSPPAQEHYTDTPSSPLRARRTPEQPLKPNLACALCFVCHPTKTKQCPTVLLRCCPQHFASLASRRTGDEHCERRAQLPYQLTPTLASVLV